MASFAQLAQRLMKDPNRKQGTYGKRPHGMPERRVRSKQMSTMATATSRKAVAPGTIGHACFLRGLSTDTASNTRTLDTPFISDTIPLAEGVLGRVEEMLAEVGQAVDENEVAGVLRLMLDLVTLVLCPALAIGIATAAAGYVFHWTDDGDEHWEIEP